ncbi:MAG: ATP-dependent helicase/nuclease subunit, partial [Candidatus Binatota bacterium]|nr:ATP-dependent helicase/nuclease subunit [Candidatus Binatota bacterium]
MTPLADQQARERIRGDLDTTLVVEAAAGTGKTTELVTRMVAALVAGRAQLGGIVAVTFTEPAAGELKLRLRSAIERERESPDCPAEARARLVAALPQLEEARIGTIHSFCADLLRERPVEAGVDPLFEVAANETTRPLFDRAFDRWFDEQLRAPSAGVTRILRRQRSERGRGGAREQGPRALLKNAAWALVERRDFPARWRHDEGFEREREIDQLLETMTAVGGRAGELPSDDWFTRSLLEIQRFLDEVRRRETLGPRDYDGLEAALAEIARGRRARFWNWKGWRAPPELREARDRLHERLLDFVDRAGADLAPRLRDELWAVVEEYERLKERAGSLDFLDLLIRARSLVRDDARVRTELQRDTTHIFVDEFQDTDPLQAEILLLLAADDPAESDWRRVRPRPGKLFVVGDPKQSIYRFRRADVALYEAVKRQILDSGGARVELTVSFRAVPEIQRGVNAAFAPRMTGEPGRPGYVPLAPFREDPAAQPAIVALPIPAPYGDFRRIVSWRIEESLPEAVAAFIQWLVQESGWTVTEATAPERRVPVEPRHVCLLFRRVRSYLTDVTRPYVRALEARRLPHLLVGGTSFHVREEVEAIRNALSAVERPDDELSVFATLRGPLFA